MQPDVNCRCGHIRFYLSDGPERVKKMLSGKCTQSVFEKCFLAYVPKGYNTSYPSGHKVGNADTGNDFSNTLQSLSMPVYLND